MRAIHSSCAKEIGENWWHSKQSQCMQSSKHVKLASQRLREQGPVGGDPKKEGRCTECGIGKDVSLEEAKKRMDPKGLYTWETDHGFSLYCIFSPEGTTPPRGVKVAFRNCDCEPSLWTRKFGETVQQTGWRAGFSPENQCKNDFQAQVRGRIIDEERRKSFFPPSKSSE